MEQSLPADQHARTPGAGVVPRLTASDLIRLAAWLGLAAGWVEVATRIFLKNVLGPGFLYLMTRHFVWLIPLSNLLLFLIAGLVLAAMARHWPRLASWLGPRLLLTAAIMPALLVSGRQIYSSAWLALAAGIAVQVAPRFERLSLDWRWWGRRTFPVLLGSIPAVAAFMAGGDWVAEARLAAKPYPPDGAPNILLIVLDTVRADRLSVYGYPRRTTPALEGLARRGIRFDEARSAAPWTLPSHASFFTGRWPHELGVVWKAPLHTRHPMLAEYLASRGYQTAGFVGNIQYCSYETGLARGFVHYEDYPFDVVHLRPFRTAILGEFAWNAATWLGVSIGTSRFSPVLHWLMSVGRKDAGAINDEFLGWLSHRHDPERPYFAFLNYYDAHAPYLPPEGTRFRFGPGPRTLDDFFVLGERWNEFDKLRLTQKYIDLILDSYENCLAYLDGRVGRLFVELQRRGELKRTIVIVTADHGEELGDHDLFEHGESLYRPESRVPLLFVLPSGAHGGDVLRQTVSLRDLPATVVDLAGVSVGSPFPGRSLARLWDGSHQNATTASDSDSDGALSELPDPNPTDPSRGRSPAAHGPLLSVAQGDYVYIRNERDGKEELFHERDDPRELVNLAGVESMQPILRRLRQRLNELKASPPVATQ
jgi:arylsulfatase A-like enzyme